MSERTATIDRRTSETEIHLALCLDGTGSTSIDTGLGFFDHMLTALIKHSRFDLRLACSGDLHVDDHHTVEDCGIALGRALDQALGDRRGIRRFAHAYAPLDEALARVVVDLSGRPSPLVDLGLMRPNIGDVAAENLGHFFETFANAGRLALHVDVLKGVNDHHRAEAAFKALALALKDAVAATNYDDVPSTKGLL
jgi:imidazoleglycerol phosphate dehydratase HisB